MFLLFCALEALTSSQRVYWTTSGKYKYLTYTYDAENNRIPHFSYVGFKHGNYSLPVTASTVKVLYPPSGDASSLIQGAINDMVNYPVGTNGFRGSILLKKGIWNIATQISINVDGVIVKGEGNGDDPSASTVIRANGDSSMYSVFYIGSSKVNWYAGNSFQTKITTPLVGMSAFKFQVDDISRFSVGQSILIVYPATQSWLDSVNRGDTYFDAPWGLGYPSVNYLRRIIYVDIATKTLFLDSPTFDKMNSSISQPYVILFDETLVTENVILRDMRIQIQSFVMDPQDQNHSQNGVVVDGSEDVWLYKLTISGFVRSGVAVYTSTRVSVTSCAAIDPIGQDTTENFYNFAVERNSQLIFFAHNFARGGRHQYVINGMSTASGIVFFDCTSINPSGVDESHRGWTNGVLFDTMRIFH
eukprot:NODE_34_length_36538_cov_0.612854.p9 type:complete len:416 gc:universal NODE_34_length_36538_cov_0.612854:16933-15686(-)